MKRKMLNRIMLAVFISVSLSAGFTAASFASESVNEPEEVIFDDMFFEDADQGWVGSDSDFGFEDEEESLFTDSDENMTFFEEDSEEPSLIGDDGSDETLNEDNDQPEGDYLSYEIEIDGDHATVKFTGKGELYSVAPQLPEDIQSVSVIIEDGFSAIGSEAFAHYFTRMTDITIPESVTSIGDFAFQNCKNLTDITIPDSVASIGDYAFRYCDKLTHITLPDSVTFIGVEAFSGCTSLTDATIPGSIASVENYFTGCSNLKNIVILPGPVSIGYQAFSKLQSLKSITIPDSVTSLGKQAFKCCTALTDFTISESITSLGDGVFWGCSGLTSITIPEGITSIGADVFYDCSGLTSVTIPDSVTSIGEYAFADCSSLTEIYIPESVTSIKTCAFYNCENLIDITIPESVTEIKADAFSCCSKLREIRIPASFEQIFPRVFSDCTSLTDVFIPGDTIISEDAFENCPIERIYGNCVTFAEYYALKHGITFIGNPLELNESIVPDISDQIYTGSALRPIPVIKYGQFTLKYKRDFTVSFSSNTNAGTAVCTVTGMERTTGTVTKTFKILPASIEDADVWGIITKGWTGSAVTQSPVVELESGKLTEDKDYTLSYSNNIAIGTAIVEITGKGNFTGTVSRTFRIVDPKELIQYKVSFNSNGGSGAPEAVLNPSAENAVTIKLPEKVPTRSGYSFKGWNTKKDGTGTAYTKSGEITLNSNAPAVTLYATWAALHKFRIIYYGNGGSNVPGVLTKGTSGLSIRLTVSDKIPTRSGYNFNGWNTKADGSGTIYHGGDSFVLKTAAPDRILYAQWVDPKTGKAPKPVAEIESVKLNKTSLTLRDMQKCTLKSTLKMSDGTSTTGIWSSSNKAVATVTQKGVITALKAGTAIITVKKGLLSATCRITVKSRIKLKSFKLNYTSKTIKAGGTFTLKLSTAAPTNASVKVIKSYAVADKTVAKVTYKTVTNANGVVTGMNAVVKGLKKGKTTIVATSQDGGYKAKCTLTVN